VARRCSPVCLPFDQARYPVVADPSAFRGALDALFLDAPALFPEAFAPGYLLRDVRPSRELRPPQPEAHEWLTLTPDGGRLIATNNGKQDGGVRVWDLHRIGQLLRDRGLAEGWPDFPPAPKATESLRLDIDHGEIGKPPG
jgi:hypothetical protein